MAVRCQYVPSWPQRFQKHVPVWASFGLLQHRQQHLQWERPQQEVKAPAAPELDAQGPGLHWVLNCIFLDLDCLDVNHRHPKWHRWRKMPVVHHSMTKCSKVVLPRTCSDVSKFLQHKWIWKSAHASCHKMLSLYPMMWVSSVNVLPSQIPLHHRGAPLRSGLM